MSKNNVILKICSLAIFSGWLAAPALVHAETIRFGGNFPVDHSSSQAMTIFKDGLEESGTDLQAELFPAMQLGGAQENVDQVTSGAIFGTWIGAAYISRLVPELEAISLPFAFDSREQAFELIDGPVGDTFNKLLAEKGLTALGYMELGFRNVTNSKRPIKEVEDLEGLKIRLQPNDTHLATFRALGANPVAMDVKELYGALQQGVLDGQENPNSIIKTERFNEVQTYLSDTKHFYDFILVVANKDRFDALDAAEQEAIMASMSEAVSWQREESAKGDEQARLALIDSGMVFTPISPEVRSELRAQTSEIKARLEEKLGSEIMTQVESELAK